MHRFKVGQVVFVLLKDEQIVLPAQIVTENKRKTREGLVITYDALVGPDGDSREFVIDEKNKDIVFDSARKVQQYLVSEATAAITRIIEVAQESSIAWYNESLVQSDDEDEDDEDDESIVQNQPYVSQKPGPKVQLDDGSIVNVIISEPKSE